ncbi:hypothetical protein K1719_032699 [Acacia pycnantha]|nr:hypothetical protein K1719_032699 [Acacia pycnantha]
MTESRGRGRYARIAVIIDLLKPLVPWILVDGKTYGVEYERLPHICFGCGKYGHTKEKCKAGDKGDAAGPKEQDSTMGPLLRCIQIQSPPGPTARHRN